jgi:hypothetical protein
VAVLILGLPAGFRVDDIQLVLGRALVRGDQAVEQIAQQTIAPSGRHASSLKLPLYLWVVMVVSFNALIIGARLLGHGGTSPPNPFASFGDVFLGQPRSAIEAQGFLCKTHVPGGGNILEEFCDSSPDSGTFSLISVGMTQGNIRFITFVARTQAFRVGDLVALRGRPEVNEYGHTAHLYWRNRNVKAVTFPYHGSFSLFLPVLRVHIFTASVA